MYERLTKSKKKRTIAVRNETSIWDGVRGSTFERYLHTRWHHNPTNRGLDEVQALGKRVSKLLMKPCMILKPVTLAVMDARVAAARALVERWPMETVPATTSEY